MSFPSSSGATFSCSRGAVCAGGGIGGLCCCAFCWLALFDALFLPTNQANKPMMTMTAKPSRTYKAVSKFVDSPVSSLGATVPSLGASLGAGAYVVTTGPSPIVGGGVPPSEHADRTRTTIATTIRIGVNVSLLFIRVTFPGSCAACPPRWCATIVWSVARSWNRSSTVWQSASADLITVGVSAWNMRVL